MIPNEYKYKAVNSILFPSDYTNTIKLSELALLIDIIKLQEAKLQILNVKDTYDLTPEQKTNKELIRILKILIIHLQNLKENLCQKLFTII